jgi:hypothetical protein
MRLEELGILFKGDPVLPYLMKEVPNGIFLKVLELRKKRIQQDPSLSLF